MQGDEGFVVVVLPVQLLDTRAARLHSLFVGQTIAAPATVNIGSKERISLNFSATKRSSRREEVQSVSLPGDLHK